MQEERLTLQTKIMTWNVLSARHCVDDELEQQPVNEPHGSETVSPMAVNSAPFSYCSVTPTLSCVTVPSTSSSSSISSENAWEPDEVNLVSFHEEAKIKMIRVVPVCGCEYFNATVRAHHTRNIGPLKDLNERYKESEVEVNKPGDRTWSPLQLAAALGDSELVTALCEHEKIDIGATDKDGDTPLHAASYWDHAEVIGLLFKGARKSSMEMMLDLVNVPNNKYETPLSCAASRNHKISCQVMIDNCVPRLTVDLSGRNSSDKGALNDPRTSSKLRVSNCSSIFRIVNHSEIQYHQKNSEGNSTVSMLIYNMPELVRVILDKSIVCKEVANDDIHRVIVDFGALENYCGEESSLSDYPEEETGGTLISGYYRHGSNPLQIMTKMSHRLEFLTHPVVEALIITKWEKFARTYFFLFKFLINLLFMIMLVIYRIAQIKPFMSLKSGKTVRTWIENPGHLCEEFPIGCFKEKPQESLVSGYLLLVMSTVCLFIQLLNLADHIFSRCDEKRTIMRWFQGLRNYVVDDENILQFILYGTSLVFSLNVVDQQTVMSPFHWQIGTLSVLAGVIKLLLLLQVFPKIGIYIIMLFKIVWTFVTKMLALLVFLEYLCSSASSFANMISFTIFVQVLFIHVVATLIFEDMKAIRNAVESTLNVLKIRHIYNAERIVTMMQWGFSHFRFLNVKLIKSQRRFRIMPLGIFSPKTTQAIYDSDNVANVNA